jgi:hypothetical protein
MKQIDILPDDVLLEMFDFYTITDPLDDDISSDEYKETIESRDMAIADPCVPTLEKPCSWITTSLKFATFLYI